MARTVNVPSSFKRLRYGLNKIASASQNPTILEHIAECFGHLQEAANDYQSLALADFMTTADAARYLGMTVTGLARLARLGNLGAVRKGNAWLFPVSEVERYKTSVAGKDLNDPTRGD